jgi:hypothetical protein
MQEKIKACEAILEVVQTYSATIGENIHLDTDSLRRVIANLKISDKFGIPLRYMESNSEWMQVGSSRYDDFMIIGLFGEEHNRTISWSDDGRQPENEWLFKIGFPTGAYIFGEYYPKDTFNKFFEELKSYSPAYSDTNNHALYFTSENAKLVYDNFYQIFDKYKSQAAEELKERRKQELIKELAKLES